MSHSICMGFWKQVVVGHFVQNLKRGSLISVWSILAWKKHAGVWGMLPPPQENLENETFQDWIWWQFSSKFCNNKYF